MRPARLPMHVSDSTKLMNSANIRRRRRRTAARRGLLALALGAACAVGACVVDGAAVLGERQFDAARPITPPAMGLGSY